MSLTAARPTDTLPQDVAALRALIPTLPPSLVRRLTYALQDQTSVSAKSLYNTLLPFATVYEELERAETKRTRAAIYRTQQASAGGKAWL